MSYLPPSKYGDCTQCPAKDTACVKVGKELVCVSCNNNNKAQKQVTKANRRNAARNLGFKLRNSEIPPIATEEYGMAERQMLIHDLDYTHSRLVRMIAADAITGLANCFTCGKLQHWTLCQLSHFIKRQNTLTRWDLKANRCSCRHCNETLGGNLIVFAKNLNEEEQGLAERLTELAREPYKWGRDELKQLLYDQRQRLRIIESKFQPQKQNP
jgi:Fe2+ or Zn2+ uptake regulation protein